MKKKCFIAFFLLATISLQVQNRADRQHLTDSASFMMVVFGDAQGYTKCGCNQPLFKLSTVRGADNTDHLDLRASTYQTLFGISPMTRHPAQRTGDCCHFEITIEI